MFSEQKEKNEWEFRFDYQFVDYRKFRFIGKKNQAKIDYINIEKKINQKFGSFLKITGDEKNKYLKWSALNQGCDTGIDRFWTNNLINIVEKNSLI